VQPDEWRGLLVRPQSLNRFAYVENSPVAFSDYLGFLPIGGGLKGGVAKAKAAAVKKGGVAAAVSKANAQKVPKHSMGNTGGGRPGTLSRGGGSPLSGVSVPASRSGQFTSIVHAGPEDCEPDETYVSGPYTDACHSTEVLEKNRQKERDFWNGVAWAWEHFSISGSVCLFICVGLGFGGGITFSAGIGLKAGADVSIGFGGPPDGLSVTGVCSVGGGIGAYGEGALGSGDAHWGGGIIVGGGGGCAAMANYRIL
jgi:hypothetical protein